MKIHDTGDILTISNIKELAAGNADVFRDEVRAAVGSDLKAIEIDLSDTDFVDSCGLGALISLYKFANSGHESVPVRLLNPSPSVQQIFELTRLHRVFEIVRVEPHVAAHQ
jgi:anti-sigma B factor antagonist